MAEAELGRVLATPEQLHERLAGLGARITRDYRLPDHPGLPGPGRGRGPQGRRHVHRGPGQGGRAARHDGLGAISTYGHGDVAGRRQVLKDVTADVAGRDVLIVEDILDTGGTLAWLTAQLRARHTRSVESCVLLREPNVAGHTVVPRYVGFDVDVHWVAGYGIDHAERWRNRKDIHEVHIALSPV